MANSIVSSLLAAVVGASAAIGTMAVVTPHRSPTSKAGSGQDTQIKETTTPPAPVTVVVRQDEAQLQALRQEVERMRPQERSIEDPSDKPEEERRHVAATFAELERRHAQDPIDPGWSPQAGRYLNAGLLQLGEQVGFHVKSADCRTEMCRATLEWRDHSQAMRMGHELAERSLPGLNCAQSVWLEEPKDPHAQYTANLYLDCSRQRAGLARVVSTQ